MADHLTIRVTVLVDADTYVNMRTAAEEDGLGDSGFIRLAVKEKLNRRAVAKLLAERELVAMEEPVQILHNGKPVGQGADR